MALIDVQVIFHMDSGLAADYSTNTWHFDDGEIEANWALFATALFAFYDDIAGGFPSTMEQAGHEIKMFKVSDPEPRAPIYQATWSLSSAPAGNPIPTEVAIVLSYHAAPISGLPMARRRGRVYLGPLNGIPIGADARIASAFQDDVVAAAQALLDESGAVDGWTWSTHSKVDESGASVTGGWVDNEPDTQRRRGRKATSRVTFP